MLMNNIYLILAKLFSSLSLSAFGGGNTILPTMEQISVQKYHWLTSEQFVDFFSLSKAAPGPTTLLVELIGMKAAGFSMGNQFLWIPAITAAVVSLLAMFIPSSLLLIVVAHFWEKWRGTPWQLAVQKGLMPITCGLILASTWMVAETAITEWVTGIMAFIALFLILYTRINPVLIMAVAGFISWIVIK